TKTLIRIKKEQKLDKRLGISQKKNPMKCEGRVIWLYERWLEIERRMIPTGLHLFGRAPELQEKADLLRMVASFDRPEHGARALPKLVAEGLGIDGYDGLLHETSANEATELIDPLFSDGIRR